MSIEGINITLEQVSATASTIKSLNSDLDTRLQEIQKEMNSLQATWQSESATTISNNFSKSAAKFEDYKKVIDSYAIFLEKTVEAYTQTEATINKNASAFL